MTWGKFDADENKAVPEGREVNPAHEIKEGDILVSRANTQAYVGAPVLVGRTRRGLLLSDKSLRLVPSEHLDRRWLVHFLSSPVARSFISDTATGTKDSMRNISQKALLGMPLALPPLGEQRRIVEVIEGYLSRLDVAKNLVAAACGRSKALQRALLQQVLERCREYPSVPLGEMIREPLRNGHSARVSESGEGVRTINLTAVTTGDFSDRNSKITVADPGRVKGLWLNPGDILVQRSNTPDLVGTSALYSGPENWAIYPDLLIRVRVNDLLLPEFAAYILSAPRVRRYFRSSAKGLAGSMPKIDQAAISNVSLPVPPLSIQREIVKQVSALSGQVHLLAAEVARTERRARHLRQSVLRKAFSGGLVAQDSSDESAATLLGEIRIEQKR
ncbi:MULTISPECIES: restriction endonuclease subunit S [Streptomyces]|uniref:restriction endonuclease subunit S n=1 Tax=Streptomyces TaxID=1883 RepID=UPI0037D4B233